MRTILTVVILFAAGMYCYKYRDFLKGQIKKLFNKKAVGQ